MCDTGNALERGLRLTAKHTTAYGLYVTCLHKVKMLRHTLKILADEYNKDNRKLQLKLYDCSAQTKGVG